MWLARNRCATPPVSIQDLADRSKAVRLHSSCCLGIQRLEHLWGVEDPEDVFVGRSFHSAKRVADNVEQPGSRTASQGGDHNDVHVRFVGRGVVWAWG